MDADLDIYVQSIPTKKVGAFGDYLIAEEGYTLDNVKEMDEYSRHLGEIDDVLYLTIPVSNLQFC